MINVKLLITTEILAWECIALDPDLECKCGQPPYDDGCLCPKCFSLQQIISLKELKESLEESD